VGGGGLSVAFLFVEVGVRLGVMVVVVEVFERGDIGRRAGREVSVQIERVHARFAREEGGFGGLVVIAMLRLAV
jgi:hypothetical protein